MVKKLELLFTTDQGKTMGLSLADPKSDLTKAAAETVMTTLISKEAFVSNQGKIIAIKACTMQTTDKVTLA